MSLLPSNDKIWMSWTRIFQSRRLAFFHSHILCTRDSKGYLKVRFTHPEVAWLVEVCKLYPGQVTPETDLHCSLVYSQKKQLQSEIKNIKIWWILMSNSTNTQPT